MMEKISILIHMIMIENPHLRFLPFFSQASVLLKKMLDFLQETLTVLLFKSSVNPYTFQTIIILMNTTWTKNNLMFSYDSSFLLLPLFPERFVGINIEAWLRIFVLMENFSWTWDFWENILKNDGFPKLSKRIL